MQADLARQSMRVRQFAGLVKAGHIGHQRWSSAPHSRSHYFRRPLLVSALIPKIVSVYYDLS
jgi:hypothetical protein